jgi:enoyl-CoA hydratase/carnithine racemase
MVFRAFAASEQREQSTPNAADAETLRRRGTADCCAQRTCDPFGNALLADVALATPDAIFQDKPHLNFGIVPGAGFHSLSQEVIGPIRARTFVLTQQIIADAAKTLGVVCESVSRHEVMARAREIAEALAKLPPLTTSYARVALTQILRRVFDESVGYGLALEDISAADVARMNA